MELHKNSAADASPDTDLSTNSGAVISVSNGNGDNSSDMCYRGNAARAAIKKLALFPSKLCVFNVNPCGLQLTTNYAKKQSDKQCFVVSFIHVFFVTKTTLFPVLFSADHYGDLVSVCIWGCFNSFLCGAALQEFLVDGINYCRRPIRMVLYQ